jgi:hypothetical protein
VYNPSELVGDFRLVRSNWTPPARLPDRIVGANPNRVCLYFTQLDTTAAGITTPPNLTINSPMFFVQPRDTFSLRWQWDGVLVTMEWWAVVATSTASVNVLEVIWFPPL